MNIVGDFHMYNKDSAAGTSMSRYIQGVSDDKNNLI